MELQELVNTIKDLALSHKDILAFDMGDNHLITGNVNQKYPLFFLETPFSIQFPVNDKQQAYLISFAFLVLLNKKEDDINEQILGISEATLITEQILGKLRKYVNVQSSNCITYNDYTNEGLSTCRTDISVAVLLNQCLTTEELDKVFTK
jgi:hypothetical protein